jgi:hypothetical protein
VCVFWGWGVLCNGSVSILDYVALNGRKTDELNLKGNGYGLIEVLFQHVLGGPEENHEHLGNNSDHI